MPIQPQTHQAIDNSDKLDTLAQFMREREQPLFKNQLSIDHMILIAGFLNATNFISFVNERIGKAGQHLINRGEALACLTALVYSGNYRSLNASESALIGTALAPLLRLAPSTLPMHLNQDVYADALEATSAYGAAKLFDEFNEHVQSLNLTDVENSSVIHIDTTSMLKMGLAISNNAANEAEIKELNKEEFNALLVKDELAFVESLDAAIEFKQWSIKNTFEPEEADGKQSVDVKHASPKDHCADKTQVFIGSAVDSNSGLPLSFRLWDGESGDKLNFADVVEHIGDAVATAFTHIKTIVGDSALCSRRTFDAAQARGLTILTCVPDDMPLDQRAYALEEPLEPICSEKEWAQTHGKKSAVPKARLIEGEELFGHKVVCCLFLDESLRGTKEKTVKTAANKELKAALKLEQKVFKCQSDAQTAYLEASKKLKYCSFEDFRCEPVMDNASSSCSKANAASSSPTATAAPSRSKATAASSSSKATAASSSLKANAAPSGPKAGAEMDVKGYRIVSTVNEDKQKIERAITHECMHLLVTTDVDRAWTTMDFQQLYKGNTHVDSIWKELKNKRLHLSRFYLQKAERAEGLLLVVLISIFARKFLKEVVATAIAEQELQLPKHFPGFNKTNPQMENIDYFFKGLNVSYSHNDKAELSVLSPTVISLLAYLGENWYTLMLSDNFEGYQDWPSR